MSHFESQLFFRDIYMKNNSKFIYKNCGYVSEKLQVDKTGYSYEL